MVEKTRKDKSTVLGNLCHEHNIDQNTFGRYVNKLYQDEHN